MRSARRAARAPGVPSDPAFAEDLAASPNHHNGDGERFYAPGSLPSFLGEAFAVGPTTP